MVIKTIGLNCWHTMGFQLWKVQAMITGLWYHVCVYHKASPDIPELEMQKWHSSHLCCVNWPWKAEAFQDSTDLLMQTNKWFTYKAKMAAVVLFSPFEFYLLPSCKPDFCPLAFQQLWHVSQHQFSKAISDLSWTPFCDMYSCSCVWAEQTDLLKHLTGLCGGTNEGKTES